MSKNEAKTGAFPLKAGKFFMYMLFAHLLVYLGILSNIPVFRAVVGFAYLLFVPGLVVLRLFKMKDLGTSEKALFAVVLSVAFVMLVGLLLDLVAPLAGFDKPLSTDILVVSFSAILLPLSLIRTEDGIQVEMRSKSFFFIALSIFILAVGACGMVLNGFGSNSFLLLLIALIAVIVCAASVSGKLVPSRFYPLILIVVCVALLFFINTDTALVSRYVYGNGDQWLEFYSFRATDILSRWIPNAAASSSNPDLLPTYSMLSVTILPTIFERITALDDSWLFNILYPAIVCFMALGAYVLYKTQTEKKIAFLAVFFFIAVSVGKGWGSDKQLVAQLFFVTLLILIFRKGLPRLKKDFLFLLLSFGLVVSHYSLAYLFMAVLVFAWAILTAVDYIRGGAFSFKREKIPWEFIPIYLAIALLWDSLINSGAVLNVLAQTVTTVGANISQFFDLQSRGSALAGLGLVQAPTPLNQVSSLLFMFTEFLVVLGFFWILTRKHSRFSSEYKLIATVCLAIIAVNIVLPRLADTFLMSRFYQTTLIVLAPFAIIGGKAILDHVPKMRKKLIFPILAFVIFVPFMLFQTGFLFEIAGIQNYNVALDRHRWNNITLYDQLVDSREVAGAVWLSQYAKASDTVLADFRAQYSVLTAYGMLGRGQTFSLMNGTNGAPFTRQYTFLRPVNVIDGKIESWNGTFDYAEIASTFDYQNKIYSAGGCEIYKGLTP